MADIDLGEFLRLTQSDFNVVPLHETLQLDRETPVSLYQRFSQGRAIFLLESAALGEETGRYSFIGLDRTWRITTNGPDTIVQGVENVEVKGHGPLDVLRSLLGRYRTYLPSELPDFFGGAVGFVTYDYVRRLENLPRDPAADMWPDIDFSFPGAVLICDHLRHSTTVVVNAVVEPGDDPSAIFDVASKKLQEIIDVLISPPPPTDPIAERLAPPLPAFAHPSTFAPSRRDSQTSPWSATARW
jgi:anthranilate synthase component 1